jgi:tetrahydromethanopterin S-methyltransferase subunit B
MADNIEKMEPIRELPTANEVQYSQAVSLKRIADSLEKLEKVLNDINYSLIPRSSKW